jgi:hypothetical protein
MDFTYFLNAIMTKVDPASSALVILIIGVLRYFIPTPENSPTKFGVPAWVNRFVLPVLPYPLGVACYMLLRDHSVGMPFHDIVIKGLFSGGLADIAYRKFKVMILGA